MSQKTSLKNSKNEAKMTVFMIPEDFLESIKQNQEKILEALNLQSDKSNNGYVTEKEAMKLLNKKSTWLWQMRRAGKILSKKIGQTTYYSLESINSLFKKL